MDKGEDDAVVPVAAGGSLSRLRVRRRMRSVLRFSPSTSATSAAAPLCPERSSLRGEECFPWPLRVTVVESGGSFCWLVAATHTIFPLCF